MKRVKSSLTSLLVLAFATLAVNASAAPSSKWDVQPTVKKSVAPANPNNVSGMAMAVIVIAPDGSVSSASIEKSTDPSLEQVVLDAVKEWRFNPAQLNGAPIECSIKVPFKFQS